MLAAGVLAAIVVLLVSFAVRTSRSPSIYGKSDLLAFYCAGDVTDRGIDPYLAVPLYACEARTQNAMHVESRDRMNGVDPAPLPQTTLLAFGAIARLPYAAAAPLFSLLILGAYGVTVWALARTIPLPWWSIAGVLALGDFETNAYFGQLPPFCLCAFALSALALVRRRPAWAGAAAACALLQPNAGVPVVIALVLWVPGARATAIAGSLAFATLGLVLGGPALAVEYARQVVPAQALAEVSASNQASLTWLAWLLGASDAAAVRIGAAGYALFCGTAILLARRLATRLGNDAALVFFPAAAVVTFGTYVHANQFAYAAPLALLLATAGPARTRVAAWTALLLVTLEFYGGDVSEKLVEVASIAIAVRFAVPERPLAVRVAAGVALVTLTAALTFALPRLPGAPGRKANAIATYLASGVDVRLASGTLGIGVRQSFSDSSVREIASKVPPWTGLALLFGIASLAAAKGNQTHAERG